MMFNPPLVNVEPSSKLSPEAASNHLQSPPEPAPRSRTSSPYSAPQEE